jgi:hypothetical protein
MPKRKRVQREHTEDWRTIQQYTLWPEQTAYELLRPIVLFGDPATKRAEETGEPRPTLDRKADAFDEQGMVSFFASRPRKQPQETARSLPPDMRQLIVDLRVEFLRCPCAKLRRSARLAFIGDPHTIRSRWYWPPGLLHLSRCAAFRALTTSLIPRSVATTLCSSMRKGGQ